MAVGQLYNTTAGDLVTQALKEAGAIGVGQTALAEDSTDALARLNWMLAQWERKRWLVYRLQTYSIVSTGAQSYTIGPGGQLDTNLASAWGIEALGKIATPGAGYAVGDTITLNGGSTGAVATVSSVGAGGAVTGITVTNQGAYGSAQLSTTFNQTGTSGAGAGATFSQPTWQKIADVANEANQSVRPARIESAFLRQLVYGEPNQVDYPLEILQGREDYNIIALKNLQSFPGTIFYDSDWPLGNIYTWPVPQPTIYGIYVTVVEQIAAMASLAQIFALPYEYYSAIVQNLALRLRPKYGIVTTQGDPLPGLAKDALNAIRGANTQIARLRTPPDMNRPGIYNIFSDRFY